MRRTDGDDFGFRLGQGKHVPRVGRVGLACQPDIGAVGGEVYCPAVSSFFPEHASACSHWLPESIIGSAYDSQIDVAQECGAETDLASRFRLRAVRPRYNAAPARPSTAVAGSDERVRGDGVVDSVEPYLEARIGVAWEVLMSALSSHT